MEKYENGRMGKLEIFFNNFLGGIAWGLGATVGAAIVLALAGVLLTKVNTVPVIGNYVQHVMQYISENQQTAIDSVDYNSQRVDNNK